MFNFEVLNGPFFNGMYLLINCEGEQQELFAIVEEVCQDEILVDVFSETESFSWYSDQNDAEFCILE